MSASDTLRRLLQTRKQQLLSSSTKHSTTVTKQPSSNQKTNTLQPTKALLETQTSTHKKRKRADDTPNADKSIRQHKKQVTAPLPAPSPPSSSASSAASASAAVSAAVASASAAVSAAVASAATTAPSLSSTLESSHFRYLNEKLYTIRSEEAFAHFQDRPADFDAYHRGYDSQMSKWPLLPVDVVIEYIRRHTPLGAVIGDFGCGRAKVAAALTDRTVHSFDIVAVNDRVTVCNIASVPLAHNSLDAAVFCLSLMGTDWTTFIDEATRTLKINGKLIVAEVRSRFTVIKQMQKKNNKNKNNNNNNERSDDESSQTALFQQFICARGYEVIQAPAVRSSHFVILCFKKIPRTTTNKEQKNNRNGVAATTSSLPDVNENELLAPCLYKKR